jgi:hypothetical protein
VHTIRAHLLVSLGDETQNRKTMQAGAMAIYHLNVSTGTRGKGSSALAKAEYICREGKYEQASHEIVLVEHGNMPEFTMQDISAHGFWRAADRHERANGRLFRQVEFALPRELIREKQIELARSFARSLTDKEKLPYSLAIHRGKGENPHVHLMISERGNDGLARDAAQWFRRYNPEHPELGGARKSQSMTPKSWLTGTRALWQDHANRALEAELLSPRIDHRSYKDQGLERIPGIHLGPNVIRMEEKGIRTNIGDQALRIAQANERIIELQHRMEMIDHDILRQDPQREIRHRIGSIDRTPGREYGDPGGRREDGHGKPEVGFERGADGADQEHRPDHPRDSRVHEQHIAVAQGDRKRSQGRDSDGQVHARSGERGEKAGALEHLPAHSFDGTHRISDSAERIGTLAEMAAERRATEGVRELGVFQGSAPQAARGGQAKEGHRDGVRKTEIDWNQKEVMNHLSIMGLEKFDIAVHDPKTNHITASLRSKSEIIEALPDLRRENAKGKDIHIRAPEDARAHGIILLSDMSRDNVDRMRADGIRPSSIIQTAPERLQAWVKVHPTDTEVRKVIGKNLAERYEAKAFDNMDRMYGRLPGFANNSAEYGHGIKPRVTTIESNNDPARHSKLLIDAAEARIHNAEKQRRMDQLSTRDRNHEQGPADRAANLYKIKVSEAMKLTREPFAADFMASKYMALSGIDDHMIAHVISSHSPFVSSRLPAQNKEHTERVVGKIFADKDVMKSVEAREREEKQRMEQETKRIEMERERKIERKIESEYDMGLDFGPSL